MVIRFPADHKTVNVETVCTVAAINIIECAAVPSSLISLKVLLCEIVFDAVLAPRLNQRLLYVFHPHVKVLFVLLVSVILMVDVFAFIVHVPLATTQTLPVPVRVKVHDPIVSVLEFALLELKTVHVTFALFAFNVHKVSVIVHVFTKLSCNAQLPPDQLNTIGQLCVLPADVIV